MTTVDGEMAEDRFKWDVALSFLAGDEATASLLADQLRAQGLRVFSYPDEQKELAGRDGENRFAQVFAEESRTVVVLYRNGWGETTWTVVEERAIRDRGPRQRYEDFLLVVNLEEEKPDIRWLPWSQLWLDYPRFGLTGAAAVITQLARQVGSTARPETAEERAARLARKREWEEERRQFLKSPEGTQFLRDERDRLFHRVEEIFEAVAREHPRLELSFQRIAHRGTIYVRGSYRSLQVSWDPGFDDSGENRSGFYAILWDESLGENGLKDEPTKIREFDFQIELIPPGEARWKQVEDPRPAYTTTGLADHLMKLFLEAIDR